MRKLSTLLLLLFSTLAIADGGQSFVYSGLKNDPWIDYAQYIIENTYGDVVSVRSKSKTLLKYGRSEQVDNTAGGTTIMTSPTNVRAEEDLYANEINKVSSTSASDAGKTLTIEGHTYSAGNLTFLVQDVTLDGTDPSATPATLTTALARITRGYLKNSGTAGSPQSDIVGTIYFYDDDGGSVTITAGVPSDTSKVHMMIRAGFNQTEKASTSISSVDYWIITGAYCDILDKASSAVAEVGLFSRDVANGGAFRKLFDMSCSTTGGPSFRSAVPYIIIPPNHDVKMVGIGDSATDRSVAAGMFGVLAKIVE